MKKNRKLFFVSGGLILFCLIIDQILKIWVKTHMEIGEHISIVNNWFLLYFVENEGMAFGMKFGAEIGKLILSSVRIIVVGVIIYYMVKSIRHKSATLLTTSILSLIIAGALGNIVDSLFYGIIFDYAPLMFGNVVDMFYFPLFKIPDWCPLWGGSYFFPAIFNIADSCVTIGIILMLIFNKRVFSSLSQVSQPKS